MAHHTIKKVLKPITIHFAKPKKKFLCVGLKVPIGIDSCLSFPRVFSTPKPPPHLLLPTHRSVPKTLPSHPIHPISSCTPNLAPPPPLPQRLRNLLKHPYPLPAKRRPHAHRRGADSAHAAKALRVLNAANADYLDRLELRVPEQLALDRIDVSQRERVQRGAGHAADAGARGRVERAV